MENPALSYFTTDFGTYFHEPADDDAIYFVPKKNKRTHQMLGHGNFNTAQVLAIKHHENLLNPPATPPKSYGQQLGAAVQRKRTQPKIQKSGNGGWMDFPNGRIVQYRLRVTDSPLKLGMVMETMGTELEMDAGLDDVWYNEEAVETPLTGDLKKDADTVVGHLMAFAKRHRKVFES